MEIKTGIVPLDEYYDADHAGQYGYDATYQTVDTPRGKPATVLTGIQFYCDGNPCLAGEVPSQLFDLAMKLAKPEDRCVTIHIVDGPAVESLRAQNAYRLTACQGARSVMGGVQSNLEHLPDVPSPEQIRWVREVAIPLLGKAVALVTEAIELKVQP